MITLPLASSSSDHLIARLIFFAFIAIIWVIGWIGSVMKKVQQEAKRRQMRAQLSAPPQAPPARPVQLAPGIAMRVPLAALAPARSKPAKRPVPPAAKAPKRAAARKPVPPAPPARQAAAIVNPIRQAANEPAAPSPQRKPIVPVTAANLSRWLRPDTLRQQFILTEILQPPLALRDQPK